MLRKLHTTSNSNNTKSYQLLKLNNSLLIVNLKRTKVVTKRLIIYRPTKLKILVIEPPNLYKLLNYTDTLILFHMYTPTHHNENTISPTRTVYAFT